MQSTGRRFGILEIHAIRSFPYGNLNRDASGQQKTMLYGGVIHTRLSSQCIKRAIRTGPIFRETVQEALGSRTRQMPTTVGDLLQAKGVAPEVVAAVQPTLAAFGSKAATSKEGETGQLLFYGPNDFEAIANCVLDLISHRDLEALKKYVSPPKSKKGAKEKAGPSLAADLADALKKTADQRAISPDVALFGRMATTEAMRNVVSAVHVAHSMSTHAHHDETDFFTGVDDLLQGVEQDDQGSAILSYLSRNAHTGYEYYLVDLDQLYTNLLPGRTPDAAVESMKQTARAFLLAVTDMQPRANLANAANYGTLHAMSVARRPIRQGQNYAPAFEVPVTNDEGRGYVLPSVEQLVEYAQYREELRYNKATVQGWFIEPRLAIETGANTPRFGNPTALIEYVMEGI